MKALIMLAVLASGNLFANTQKTVTCREAIVDAQGILGNSIAATDFSTRKFEDLNISAEEFNDMSSEVQSEIYMQVKPLQVMLDETISDLSGRISRYQGSVYAFFYVDEIAEMQAQRDVLRSCSMEE